MKMENTTSFGMRRLNTTLMIKNGVGLQSVCLLQEAHRIIGYEKPSHNPIEVLIFAQVNQNWTHIAKKS